MPERLQMRSKIFLILIFLLLFWGGLGLALVPTAALAIVFSVTAFIFWDTLAGQKIEKPPGLILYLVFLVVISTPLLSGGLQEQGQYLLMLFFGGGAFWMAFYNLKKALSDQFIKVIIFLGVVFGLIFLGYLLFGRIPELPWNLYSFSTVYRNHNHLGDLWALVELVVLYQLIKKKKWFWWILGLAGIFFLAVSLSRSAYVAFAAGASFLAWRMGWLRKYAKTVMIVLCLPILLFLGVGLFKTTLYSRVYFIQAILGVFKHPLGVGLGNFAQVSNEIGNTLNISAKSALAHNIILEVVIGAGLLGIVFIGWLLKVLRETLIGGEVLYSALFVALTANFFFDTTYYIPAMLWLWFMLLGLAQAKK